MCARTPLPICLAPPRARHHRPRRTACGGAGGDRSNWDLGADRPRPCVRHRRACAGRPPSRASTHAGTTRGRRAPVRASSADQRDHPSSCRRCSKILLLTRGRSLAASTPGLLPPIGDPAPGPGWWLTYCHEKRPPLFLFPHLRSKQTVLLFPRATSVVSDRHPALIGHSG